MALLALTLWLPFTVVAQFCGGVYQLDVIYTVDEDECDSELAPATDLLRHQSVQCGQQLTWDVSAAFGMVPGDATMSANVSSEGVVTFVMLRQCTGDCLFLERYDDFDADAWCDLGATHSCEVCLRYGNGTDCGCEHHVSAKTYEPLLRTPGGVALIVIPAVLLPILCVAFCYFSWAKRKRARDKHEDERANKHGMPPNSPVRPKDERAESPQLEVELPPYAEVVDMEGDIAPPPYTTEDAKTIDR